MLQPRKPLDLSSANEILKSERPPLDLSGAEDILKKKESTVIPIKSDLETSTGSSGGVEPKGFPEIDTNGIFPDFNKMKSAEENPIGKEKRLRKELSSIKVTPQNMESVSLKTDELRKIEKANELKKRENVKRLEQNFYSNIKPKDIDIKAEQEADDIINKKGFLNTIEDYARTGYNKVAENLPYGLQNLKVDKDSTIEYRRNVVSDAKKNKEKLSEQQIQDRTKQAIFQEKKQAIYDDRVNSYLDDLPEEDKNTLYQDRASKSTHLNDENTKLNKVFNAKKSILETKVNEYKDLESELMDIKNSGMQIPQEKYDAYLNYQNEIKNLANDFSGTANKLQKNTSDLGTVEQELDMFKRDYGDLSGMAQKAGLTAIDLGAGFVGGLDYLATLGGTFDDKNYKKTLEDVSSIQEYTKEQRGFIRKPISEVKSPEGFMNYVSDVISNQAPILAATNILPIG